MKRAYSLEVNGSTRVTRASFRRRLVTVKFTVDTAKLTTSLKAIGEQLKALQEASQSGRTAMLNLRRALEKMNWRGAVLSGYRDARHARAVERLQLVYWPDAVELHWH